MEGLYNFISVRQELRFSWSDGLVRRLEERGKGWGSVLREMGEADHAAPEDLTWRPVNL